MEAGLLVGVLVGMLCGGWGPAVGHCCCAACAVDARGWGLTWRKVQVFKVQGPHGPCMG